MTKKPTTFALRGAVCFSTDSSHLTCLEDAYLVCQNGLTIGVYPQLPEQFHGIPCEDFNNCLIVPGMNDLHLHAPQYAFHGMYMDLELLDWLNTVTFPEEARYADLNYAEKAYSIFTDDIKHSATTRASIFGTLHVDATELLMDLMEKTGRKQKEVKETLSGAWVVFGVGALAAVALAVAGVGARIYQTHEQERLNQRIAEEQSIEDVYAAYNNAKSQYDNFQSMYAYTNTPNEGLEAFIQEMEEKMPSSITVETFSSTGSQVSFSMRVASKSEAANTLIQLRTFDSLSSVTTTGIDEGEDGTVTMSVTCTYRNPALLDDAE